MPNRSHRSTRGKLPKRLEDFVVSMSNPSTPIVSDNDHDSTPSEASADDTIVEQRDSSDDVIACLMKRLKVLEDNNQLTMQQLVQSETKRAQLQEQWLRTSTALESSYYTTAQIPATTTATIRNTTAAATYCSTFPVSTNTTTLHYSLPSQPIVATTFGPTQCQPAVPWSQRGNIQTYLNQSNIPVNMGQSNIRYTHTPHTISAPTSDLYSSPYITYTNTGLPNVTNIITPQSSFIPTYSNIFSNANNSAHQNTRKLYDLPEFHGYPEQWPVFIAAFTESTNAYGYSALENTFRLQKCLKGSAREEVECLLINPRNITQIIEQLGFKYGRPELLIKSQLQKVREISAIPENHLEKLVPFATKVQNLTTFLKSCDAVQHISNPTLMEELIAKMPMTKRIEWSSYSSSIIPYPTLDHFNSWINHIARVIVKVTPNVQPTLLSGPMKNNISQPRINTKPILTVVEDINKICCIKCKNSHLLFKCEKFLEMPVKERWSFVKNSRLCFSCLRKGHNVAQCRRKRVCNVNDCKKLHNVSLHEESNLHKDQINVIDRNPLSSRTTKLLYKIVPIEIRGPNGKVIQTHAFIDEGSSLTIIRESLALQMGCKRDMKSLTMRWFKDEPTTVPSMSIQVEVKGTATNKRWHQLKARSVPKLHLPSQSINMDELHDKFKHLKKLPISGYTEAIPGILIGLDNCHLTPSLKSIQLNEFAVAANTPLGWVVYGRTEKSNTTSSGLLSVILHTRDDNDECVEKLISDYFTTENFGVALPDKQLESDKIKRARQILRDTTRKVNNHYETGLLWNSDYVELPDSFNMALKRLQSLERKMRSNKEFSTAYKECMDNFISKGYAKKLSPAETATSSPSRWYLPHFAVFNINKPGKLRLVFDAAASVNGVSLNSKLLKGPDENQSLTKILFQFREGNIAVCADIKEMFLQVRIRESDQNVQRFLWRFDQNKAVETYTMVSMIFGATCSPCSAQYVKNINAMENANGQHDVVSAILNNHYVDDMVCSFRNEDDALRISVGIKETHAKAGFKLRGFISNSPNVQQKLNGHTENKMLNVNMNSADNIEKVLGMFWKNDSDEFIFELRMNRVDPEIMSGMKRPTKRELLCLVMSVYDPFGMIANLLIYGKILLQQLWRAGVGWDEMVPTNIYKSFALWMQSLQIVKEFRLPRCYNTKFFDDEASIELHIFNDASETAFASVAYWRILTNGEVYVCFIVGKTKCAPLKVLSVPRLELQAAVMGTRLRKIIIECHRIRLTKTVLWSDSKTVISWIKSDHRQYKPFVMHRVSEILDSTNESEWRWVPTKLNPADAATRTNYPINYSPENMWIKGPSFLLGHEQTWPQLINLNTASVEEKRKHCMVAIETSLIDFSRFSSYLRLCRVMAWVMRFGGLCRKKIERYPFIELTANELYRAEVRIIKIVQLEMYPMEINDLSSSGVVSRCSSILSLTPQFNADGLMCVYGRIDYATALPESTRHPIILPNRHIVSDMIIMWYHSKWFHQNDDLIVNEVRRKFWIPHLRAAVKRIKSKCQRCKNNRAEPKPPIMGQLPKDRLQPYVRPFTFTGLDYFGPMYVTIGRRREKRWAALFTCLTIRAVHIELAADLSTDACIIAIRNFVNRRGVPVKIRSDMGTNFVGTDRELRRVSDLFDHNFIRCELASRNIIWEFNCPANPSSGGCWERLIQSTKRVLAVTLKEIAPQVETLRSLLIEAENVVNSRPLTHLPVTPESPEPLTPNHFLLGTTNSTQTPFDDSPICSRKQYRISQQLRNKFWRQWIREYLPTLTRRTKWFAPQKPIAVNDVVIICDENQPRSQWKRGTVTRKLTNKDGTTRIVEVRTANGTLRRPVSKLAVLDVCSEVPRNIHEGRDVAAAK